jgi:PPM family protein phosphatase
MARMSRESMDRNRLVRLIGDRGESSPDMSVREGRIGDRYLLCTDGLLLRDARSIHQVLGTVEDPRRAAARLVDDALAASGPDHVTCVVVDLRDGPPR